MYRQISEIQPEGIEPTSLAWQANILPLNHGCLRLGVVWIQIIIYTNGYRMISLYGFLVLKNSSLSESNRLNFTLYN